MTTRWIVLAGVMALAAAANASKPTYRAAWSFNFNTSPIIKVTGGGVSHMNAYSGKITATRGNPNGGTVDNTWLGAPGSSIGTFCAELSQDIHIPGTYTHDVEILNGTGTQHTIGSANPVTFDLQRTLRLEKLWGNYSFSTATSAAAFQLAQWNILFDTDLSVSNNAGTFFGTFASGQSAIETAANAMLNGLDSKTKLATVFLLSSTTAQDQIYGTTTPGGPPPGATPEPFTLSLGLASAGLFVRRRLRSGKV